MNRNIKTTNLRFNLDKEIPRKAWEDLQSMDRAKFKSNNQVIANAIVEYFDRYEQKQQDPYLETREKEDQFVARIIEAVEASMQQALPLFLAGYLAGTGQKNIPSSFGLDIIPAEIREETSSIKTEATITTADISTVPEELPANNVLKKENNGNSNITDNCSDIDAATEEDVAWDFLGG